MNNKTIVITRPKGEGDALQDLLREHGFRVLHEPLSHVALEAASAPMLLEALETNPDVVLLTSRHGVGALAAFSLSRDLALLCVGEATANAAESAGFSRVATGGGTVEQMLEYIAASYDSGSRFLYICGKHTRMDLADILTRQGFPTARAVVYEARAAENFSDVFAEQLKRGQIDAVTFLSPRAARIFTTLAKQAGLENTLAKLQAFALSGDVAEALPRAQWKKIHVAAKPTLASLIASIDNMPS